MKVFIQNRKSGDYLSADGRWVPGRESALSFANSTDAFKYCLEQSLGDCDILMYYGRSDLDVRLPFRPGQASGRPKATDPAAEI
jgi:hypothetical protein